jgi:uncharacterized membrane protein YgaE (UPF0421/DUF939 family)
MSIMISIKGENPVLYSIDRISNTLIGILVTIIVNNLLFHTDLVVEVDNSCRRIKSTILGFIKEKVCSNNELDFNRLDDEIERIKKELNEYMQEYVFKKEKRERIDQLRELVDSLICINRHLKLGCLIDKPFSLNGENYDEFRELFNEDCSCNKKELSFVARVLDSEKKI